MNVSAAIADSRLGTPCSKFAMGPGLAASVLAAQSFDVLFKYASGLRGCACPSRNATPGYPLLVHCNGWNATNRHE
jgi:hypothetical protein